jgi:pimeloyl-ACP methyl ester carboxylesterase
MPVFRIVRTDMRDPRDLSRREVLRGITLALTPALLGVRLRAGAGGQTADTIGPYAAGVLPAGIRSRLVDNGNGITMHVLEAGFEPRNRPLVVLLHGFPELAYSWRKVMPGLASAGYHVIAPDLRGYGRSSGTGVEYDDDIAPYRTLNEVRDVLGLTSAFGARSVAAVVGHDFGSPIAGWCALARPDVFRAVAMISSPFPGPPALPFGSADAQVSKGPADSRERAYDDLEKLTPPRRYYQRYYATREANANMQHAKQGVHAFLRAYYHMKSADWKGNKPAPLSSWSASELAKMPHYYVMDRDKGGMAENVAPEMPSAAEIATCRWMTEAELTVYSTEYGRTGFQGGLQSYRLGSSGRYTDAQNANELKIFSGRTIDVPSMVIGGRSDWGVYQRPGALENMQKTLCTRMTGIHFIDGAGHWVQQEQPEAVTRRLLEFLQHAH